MLDGHCTPSWRIPALQNICKIFLFYFSWYSPPIKLPGIIYWPVFPTAQHCFKLFLRWRTICDFIARFISKLAFHIFYVAVCYHIQGSKPSPTPRSSAQLWDIGNQNRWSSRILSLSLFFRVILALFNALISQYCLPLLLVCSPIFRVSHLLILVYQ